MSSTFYFAYGSNMLKKVIADRRGIDYLYSMAGTLSGWRLIFNCPGVHKHEPSFANIEESVQEKVEGVVYCMPHEEFSKLVKTEGGMYATITIPVTLVDGTAVEAKTLISHDIINAVPPSSRYLKLLIEGAEENELSSAYIDHLSKTEHKADPDGYAFVCFLVSIYLRVRFFLLKAKS